MRVAYVQQKYKQLLATQKTTHLIVAFLMFWIPVIVFAKLAGEIVEEEPVGFDKPILEWIYANATPFWDRFFLFFTTAGNPEYALLITSAIVCIFINKKQRRNTLILLFGAGGAAASNVVLKFIFQRERPAFWQSPITETGYSFPSGHAMISSAVALCLIAIFWHTKWRWLVVVLGTVIAVIIGLSRVYLGVHFPTDIIAGWSVSLVWVLIVLFVVGEIRVKVHPR